MKNMRSSLLKWRYFLISLAVAAFIIAFLLWLADGAWEYGSMPTKGLFRTFLFASGSIVCLGASIFLSGKRHEG